MYRGFLYWVQTCNLLYVAIVLNCMINITSVYYIGLAMMVIISVYSLFPLGTEFVHETPEPYIPGAFAPAYANQPSYF